MTVARSPGVTVDDPPQPIPDLARSPLCGGWAFSLSMSLNRQTLSAPSVGGGGSTGPYVTIYDNASVTPQAALWTIVDGRVTQVGLDVRATIGTTAITTAQGLTFDGDFDLSPIGATLATWTSRNCTYNNFTSGACANLSFVDFYGALPSTVGSTIGTLDLSGCTNALVVWLGGPVTTAITLPTSLVEIKIANVNLTLMTFAALDASGSNIATFFANHGDFTAGLDLSNCANLTDVTLDYCSFGVLDLSNLNLETFTAAAATFTSVDLSGCSALTTVNLVSSSLASVDMSNCSSLSLLIMGNTAGPFTLNVSNCVSLAFIDDSGTSGVSSLNVTGCTALATILLPAPNLTTVTLTTLPAATTVGFQGCALNVVSVNAILVALDANGLSGGQVYLDLGTNAAPTGVGITAKNNLIAKGWTVATN